MKTILLILMILLYGCSSTQLVNSYKNEQEIPIKINKLLVVGMSSNLEARNGFESGIQKAMEKKKIKAVPSLEYFSKIDLLHNLSESEVTQLENQLLLDDFNIVLLSRVLSVENKKSLANYNREIGQFYSNFKQAYLENQFIYGFPNEEQIYKIFHTETAVYHLSKDDKRELLWRGSIDIVDPENSSKSIRNYIKLLTSIFEKESIFVPDNNNF